MRKIVFSFFLLMLFVGVSAQNGRKIVPMDSQWRFATGTHTDAVKPDFKDAGWRLLDVPHDWSIEGEYSRDNPTGRGGGYLPAGDGWYRKQFSLPQEDRGKKVFIEFDGVMANSEVYINGHLLGIWPYGYTAFIYDMSDHVKFGNNEKNILTVRANNIDQPASRWFTGAGIYRRVRMFVKDPVHIPHWGVFVTTPEVSKTSATVKAEVEVTNQTSRVRNITVHSAIIDKDGKVVRSISSNQRLQPNTAAMVTQNMQVSNPLLWDLKNTHLYTLETKVMEGRTLLDNQLTSFGIRSLRFDAAKGFFLNDEPMKMYGVCLHHDGGGVGAAVPLGVWEYRFERLKQAGINAIRASHNPMAKEFYELCDRMGFLVMDESFDTWEYAKNPFDYHRYFNDWWERDTRAMVLRVRNHPSVVMYSVGNEIRDNLRTPDGFRKYKQQQDLINKLDPTRPVTMALFRPNTSGVYENGFADMMNIVGQNYRPAELLAAHRQNPNRKVVGTENIHDLETYLALRDNEFMMGQFLWPGIDYLGEALWPKIAFDAGLLDKAGGWKRNGLLRKAWWGTEPTVSVVRRSDNDGSGEWVHDWSPVDPITYDEAHLEIYTNAEEVELFLNNESQGVFKRPANNAPIKTVINFRKGELRAEARTGGKVVARDVHVTAGKPFKIVLMPHRSSISNNTDDVSYVKAMIVDEKGVHCPNAHNIIQFKVEGAGYLKATDSGDAFSHESGMSDIRTAFMGVCYAIVMANKDTGEIKITASAEGIEGVATAVISVK